MVTDKCSLVVLQPSATTEADVSCGGGVFGLYVDNPTFEFSCQLQAADDQIDRSCKCLEAQTPKIQGILGGLNNPFSKVLQHQFGWRGSQKQGPADMWELLDDGTTIHPSRYPVTELRRPETSSLEEEGQADSQTNFVAVPGFYMLPSPLPMNSNMDDDGYKTVRRLGKEPGSKVAVMKRFSLVAGHLLEMSS